MLLFIIVISIVCCKICLLEIRDRYMFYFDMCEFFGFRVVFDFEFDWLDSV